MPTFYNFGIIPGLINSSSVADVTVTSITNSLLGAAALTASTTPTVGNNNNGYWTLTIPWNITYLGSSFNQVFVCTNSFLTFGAGSIAVAGPGNFPQLPKIGISAWDNSAERIYSGTEGTAPNRTYRIRYEGTANSTGGTLGFPTLVWEAVFYEATPSQIDIQCGVNPSARFYGVCDSFSLLKLLIGVTNQGNRITTTTVPINSYSISSFDDVFVPADAFRQGGLWMWGSATNASLGDNTQTSRSIPVTTFAGGNNWKQVACGQNHTAAIKTDGTLWTWGYGNTGQLGDNTTSQRNTPVTTFAGGTNWKQVASGTAHTAAIKTDGTLWTWGYGGSGRLGNGVTTFNVSTPVTTFAGGSNWKQVSAGGQHTIALKDDGVNKQLYVFGSNSSTQLGVPESSDDWFPNQTFAGGTNWKQVSGGQNHTAAIKTDGTLWTWGFNASGQLGDNTIISRSTPVTTFAGGTNWKQVAGGQNHTAAIQSSDFI